MSQPVFVTRDEMGAFKEEVLKAIAALGIRHGEEFVRINKRLDKIEKMLEQISGQITPKH